MLCDYLRVVKLGEGGITSRLVASLSGEVVKDAKGRSVVLAYSYSIRTGSHEDQTAEKVRIFSICCRKLELVGPGSTIHQVELFHHILNCRSMQAQCRRHYTLFFINVFRIKLRDIVLTMEKITFMSPGFGEKCLYL